MIVAAAAETVAEAGDDDVMAGAVAFRKCLRDRMLLRNLAPTRSSIGDPDMVTIC